MRSLRKALIALSSLFLSLQISEAIRCWKCDNAINNDDCIDRGQSIECTGEQGGCISEIRFHWGLIPPIRITKRCKQELACDNNVIQNVMGYFPFQCNPRAHDSTCRCCCETDDCNKPELGCLPAYPSCRTLVTPQNGAMRCQSDEQPPTVGETCEFTCDEGYKLQGARVLVCGPRSDKVSAWNHAEPVCVRLRCNPEYTRLPNGQVDCTNRNFVASICTFRCRSGYVMDGHDTSTCLSSQNWDYQRPRCIPIRCTPMTPPTYGRVTCTNRNLLLSVCRFSCEKGFKHIGAQSSTCTDDGDGDRFGRWSNPVPRCGKVYCHPQSRNPTNGEVDCTKANYGGSICKYKCHGEHVLIGVSERTCEDAGDGTETGRWSDPEPTCGKIICTPRRISPQHGQVSCTKQNFLGSVCTYKCKDGYKVSPSRNHITICKDDEDGDASGVWTRPAPVCIPGKCQPQMSNPINGRVSCSNDNYVRSVCRFSCDKGYHLRSVGGLDYSTSVLIVVCRQDNTWSQQQPTCERITCDPPHRSTPDKVVTCSDSNNYGSKCTWRCKNGAPITGQTISVCQENGGSKHGKWEPPRPANECKRIVCQPMQVAPQNGRVACTDRNNDLSKCTFRCNEGYYIADSSRPWLVRSTFEIECAGGVWSDGPPVCKPMACVPKFQNPMHGSVGCTQENRLGSECTFRCKRGYRVVGNSTTVCQDDSIPHDRFGQWSNPAPICGRVPCLPQLVAPLHGSMKCTGEDQQAFESVCTFTCDKGYYMVHQNGEAANHLKWTSRCNGNGKWSKGAPTCKRITCNPEQRTLENGVVECSDKNNYESECVFACSPGFKLSSSQDTIVCHDDEDGDPFGKWSHPSPTCVPKSCSPPQKDPTNGKVSCSHGSNYNSVCTFRCKQGYYQETATGDVFRSNDLTTECLSTLEWSTLPPRCRKIICSPPHVDPLNGVHSCTDGNRLGSSCTFECAFGYKISGESRSTCEGDNNGDQFGEWSSRAPKCNPIQCNPEMSNPRNGEVKCSNKNLSGSICNFSCKDGYYLETSGQVAFASSVTSTCDGKGEWSVTAPLCKRIQCVDISNVNVPNGNIECNPSKSLCALACNIDYTFVPGVGGSEATRGSIVTNCIEDDTPYDDKGKWSEPLHSCEPGDCPELLAPQNGIMECSDDFALTSDCIFICNRGYYMEGLDGQPREVNELTRTCGNNLIWTLYQPTCKRITCAPAQSELTSGQVSCTEGNYVGSRCTYTCNPGHAMVGSPTTRCEQRDTNSQFGSWTNPPPTCKENLCDETLPKSPENGIVVCPKPDANVLGSVCRFFCDRYHTRVGPPESTCIETDAGPRWSHTTPECVPDRCEPPRNSIRYGKVTCTKENFVTSGCTFECPRPGFQLYPADVTNNHCLNSKVWDKNPPCCMRPCPPFARMDAFIILDSSSSVRPRNWGLMKSFVREIIDSFTVSKDTSHFSILRYNGDVDVENRITLGDFPENKTGLLEAFDNIPYNGFGTNTGKALQYTADTLMTAENGDRQGVPNLLIIFTDGRSQDGVKAISERLRRDGVITLAVGIGTGINRQQLLEIGGDQSHVFTPRSFRELTVGLRNQITAEVCGEPCEQIWDDV